MDFNKKTSINEIINYSSLLAECNSNLQPEEIGERLNYPSKMSAELIKLAIEQKKLDIFSENIASKYFNE